MVKTPEEYFNEHAIEPPENAAQSGISAAEQAFLHKYVGVEGARSLGIALEASPPSSAAAQVVPVSTPLHEELKEHASIQMIFFHLGGQVYTIPIDAVQEVIRYVPPTSLPLAPRHVAGVINLRGRVTPLLHLEQMLCTGPGSAACAEASFIIVCSCNGLQVGLIVEKIHNMYTIHQNQIIWNVESQIGANADFLCGIIDFNDKVYGIVSIDMIVDHVIQS